MISVIKDVWNGEETTGGKQTNQGPLHYDLDLPLCLLFVIVCV